MKKLFASILCLGMIFGNWQPYRIAAASLFFGIMKTLAYTYTAIPFLSALGFPSVVYKLIPYVATLILLAFTSKILLLLRLRGFLMINQNVKIFESIVS